MRTVMTACAVITFLMPACTDLPLSRCDFQPSALCVGTPLCVPDCSERECGPDPECGISCGSCGAYSLCDEDAGQCQACDHEALCADRECGEDGCGLLCGVCDPGESCQDGACTPVCVPSCKGQMCGDDGCGGLCGGCPEGGVCEDGLCAYPEGHYCAPSFEAGCPDCPEGVEACTCANDPSCCDTVWDAYCVEIAARECESGCELISRCAGNPYLIDPETTYTVRPDCGQDQWGRSCGSCPPGETCHGNSTCVAGAVDLGQPCTEDLDCLSQRCLTEAPDKLCTIPCTNAAHCPEAWTCDQDLLPEDWQGLCRPQAPCFPDCDGRLCGTDGCGGTCGVCPEGAACTPGGSCAEATKDPCLVNLDAPGCDGCECEAEVCDLEPACCLEAWSPYCRLLCDSVSEVCGLETCHPAGTPCDGTQVSMNPSCWGCDCQECVCNADPHCCLKQWDDLCVIQCSICEGSSS